jgi:hypothetical protein
MGEWFTTVLNGALGGLTFGLWHAYISNRMIEENNNIIDALYRKRLTP